MWGYKIKKQVETKYEVKLRHGALYPLLNTLEQKGFLKSQQQRQGGRTRKVYTIRSEGTRYLEAYYSFLKEQLQNKETDTSGTREKNEFQILKQKAEKTN
jgi:DNA-binding PadR family transcriptional regulator